MLDMLCFKIICLTNVCKENWGDTGVSQSPNVEDIIVAQMISLSTGTHYIKEIISMWPEH